MSKKAVKIIVDTAMFILLLLLMEEHLISGGVHEWMGLAILVLFALHNALNYKWYRVLFKGKYTVLRIVQTAINTLFMVAMLVCTVSSVMVSGTVFSFMDLHGAELGRRLHMLSTMWVFVLMSIHLGLHWDRIISKANRIGSFALLSERIAWRLTVSSVCVFGIAVFVQRSFYEELFLLTQFKDFDYSKTPFVYLLETAAMATVFVAVAYYIKKLGLTLQKNRKEKYNEKIIKTGIAVMLALCTVFSFAACGGDSGGGGSSSDGDPGTTDNIPEKPATGESKILIAYFSWSGNTQQLANMIAEETGGDLFRIVPETPYTNDDVFDRAQSELNNGVRPALSEHIEPDIMAEYDVIFVGFPIWWYDLPMPVWTFLEEYDLAGKTIIPFFSHNGSSSGAGSLSTLQRLCPDSTVLRDKALSVSGNSVGGAKDRVADWLKGLHI